MISSLFKIKIKMPNFLRYGRFHNPPTPQITPGAVTSMVDNPTDAMDALNMLSKAVDPVIEVAPDDPDK